MSFTLPPSRARFSHILRVTPPRDMLMAPGLLSAIIMGFLLRPQISTLAAPMPTAYSKSFTRYIRPLIYPFF